jgi:anthranilate phosphoribosyltransferase
MTEVMGGSATPAQIAGFLVALQAKGVQGAELADLVDVMLAHSVPVQITGESVDTCGTGGDHSGSVNISTMAAVAVAAVGRPVVKHGNRAASSKSGSADVLEALGVVVDLAPELIGQCVDRAGIAFCFAPVFHPSMRFAGPVRRELGVPTVFNILGPLANPARPNAQVVGVADLTMAPKVADALRRRGTSALVVRGENGMDELTTLGPSRIWDCRGASVTEVVVEPEELGFELGLPGSLDGGDADENAAIARDALSAEPSADLAAVRDAVILNAAAALVCLDSTDSQRSGPKRRGGEDLQSRESDALVTELRAAAIRVREALDRGDGTAVLDRWAVVSAELANSHSES